MRVLCGRRYQKLAALLVARMKDDISDFVPKAGELPLQQSRWTAVRPAACAPRAARGLLLLLLLSVAGGVHACACTPDAFAALRHCIPWALQCQA